MATPPDSYFADPQFQTLESAFHDYVAQGEGRNVSWLAQRTGLPIAVVAKGMVAGFWMQRIQSIGKDAALVVQQKLIGDVAGMNERDVSRLVTLEDAAFNSILTLVQTNLVKPDTLVKLFLGTMRMRREVLGLGEGLENPLRRLLEASLGNTPGAAEQESKPFTLDPQKLEAPADLPKMPGMTSDEAGEDPHRELDDEEKELLRP